jgi:hypothetical protein
LEALAQGGQESLYRSSSDTADDVADEQDPYGAGCHSDAEG